MDFGFDSAFTNNETIEKENISAKRRWVFGEKSPPFTVRRLEKINKTSNFSSISHYVQKGPYSLRSLNGNILLWRYNPENPLKRQEFTHEFKDRIQNIIPVKEGNLFIVVAERYHLFLVTPNGRVHPVSQDRSFHWSAIQSITYNNSHYIIAGTNNGEIHVIEFSQQQYNISFHLVTQFKVQKQNEPISSLSIFYYNNNAYLIISIYLDLYYLSIQEIMQQNIQCKNITKIFNENENLNGHKFPSYIVCNETHLTWLTEFNLFIIPIKELFNFKEEHKNILRLSTQKISNVLEDEVTSLVGKMDTSPRILLTHYHSILLSNNYIIAICLDNGKLAFRYPFLGYQVLSMNPDYSGDYFNVLSQQYIFRISYENESSPAKVLTTKFIREQHIREVKSSDKCQPCEVLFRLIHNNQWDLVNKFLSNLITQIRDSKSQILLQFLIFEFEIYYLSEQSNKNKNDNFKIHSLISTNEIDIYNIAMHLIKMRAFSNIFESIHNQEFFTNTPKTKSIFLELIYQERYSEFIEQVYQNSEYYYLIPSISIRSPKSFIPFISNNLIDYKTLTQILPFLSEYLNNEILYNNLQQSIQIHNNKMIFEFLLHLSHNQGSQEYDSNIYEQLSNINSLSISEPFILINALKKSKFYLTSSYFSSQIGLYYEAYQTTKDINSKISKEYENQIQEFYHKMLYRSKTKEETLNTENLSKTEIVNELENVLDTIKNLTKKSKENVSLLTEIENWNEQFELNNNYQQQQQQQNHNVYCNECNLNITESEYFEFECGHVFHRKCLINNYISIYKNKKLEIIELENQSMNDENQRQKLYEIIGSDCPLCGTISTELLNVPIVNETGEWNLTLSN